MYVTFRVSLKRSLIMAEISAIPPFVHLHVHSSYSVSEGLSTPAEICAYAHLAGYRSIALSDTDGTYGFMEFHREAKQLGIKPIYGAVIHHSAFFADEGGKYRIGLIAVSRIGLRNLCALTSVSFSRAGTDEGVSLSEIQNHRDGLLFLVGAPGSEMAHYIAAERHKAAAEAIDALRDAVGEEFYIEIQDHGEAEDKQYASALLAFVEEYELRPLFTHDVRYVGREKHRVFDFLSDAGAEHADRDLFLSGMDTKQRGLLTPQEMTAFHERYRTACENSAVISDLIAGDLIYFPQ